jgi:hypothetical protein
MKELPPETSAELRQQAVRNRDWLRVSNFKFIIACYLVILGLLTIVLHTGFNPMLRPLVILLSIGHPPVDRGGREPGFEKSNNRE